MKFINKALVIVTFAFSTVLTAQASSVADINKNIEV